TDGGTDFILGRGSRPPNHRGTSVGLFVPTDLRTEGQRLYRPRADDRADQCAHERSPPAARKRRRTVPSSVPNLYRDSLEPLEEFEVQCSKFKVFSDSQRWTFNVEPGTG